MGTHQRRYYIDDPHDRWIAATAMRSGAVVAQAFGNFYALTTRPDQDVVQRVNRLKGRPLHQVGSVLTTRRHIDAVFDWDAMPVELDRSRVRALMDDLLERGPFGFRGPAAASMADHLTAMDGAIRTTQLISPGYRCPSNALLDEALDLIGTTALYVTSANRSRHLTGAEDEPAHFEADGLDAELGGEDGFMIIRHRSETVARARYPLHAPMSTTVLAVHRLVVGDDGRPSLVVERHGSLSLDDLAGIVDRHGFGLAIGPKAMRRLTARPPQPTALRLSA